jgi:voltage-gated potassium channel
MNPARDQVDEHHPIRVIGRDHVADVSSWQEVVMEQQEQDAKGPRRPVARPLDRAIGKFGDDPTSARLAMLVIVIAVITTVVVGGVLMWLVDRREYPDLGVAFWYVLQTVTTVGYGDVTPSEPLGRAVGGVIMVLAFAFLAIVTASITSVFLESRQRGRREQQLTDEAEHRAHLEAQFEHLLDRLDAIERRFSER